MHNFKSYDMWLSDKTWRTNHFLTGIIECSVQVKVTAAVRWRTRYFFGWIL